MSDSNNSLLRRLVGTLTNYVALSGEPVPSDNECLRRLADSADSASGKPVVSSGAIADLSTAQQATIAEGTIVTTTDGKRWVYSGTGFGNWGDDQYIDGVLQTTPSSSTDILISGFPDSTTIFGTGMMLAN